MSSPSLPSSQLTILPTEHLTYSTGPRGSFRLRNALARYFEKEFASTTPITAEDLFITPGLAGAIDALAFSLCDPGEGVMVQNLCIMLSRSTFRTDLTRKLSVFTTKAWKGTRTLTMFLSPS